MTPHSPETRIGELERDMARMQQRVQDLSHEVATLGQLPVGQARMEEGLKNLQDDLREANILIAHVRQSIRDREARAEVERREQLTDSRNWRRALILGSFTVLAAIIAAAATVIASTP
jgi:uncharacterized coiled-coil protein SlyX